jgi:hypothetical protein
MMDVAFTMNGSRVRRNQGCIEIALCDHPVPSYATQPGFKPDESESPPQGQISRANDRSAIFMVPITYTLSGCCCRRKGAVTCRCPEVAEQASGEVRRPIRC